MHRTEITVADIKQLRDEAASAGDLEQVGVCDRALAGTLEALDICADVIGYARMRASDDAPDYCGCCGGLAAEPPKGEHNRCCRDLHDA